MLGYRDLLCDGCNLCYRTFALPGAVPESSRQKRRRRQAKAEAAKVRDVNDAPQEIPAASSQAAEERSPSTNPFAFLRYYVKLRFDVLLGQHETPRPLDIGWRWRHWKRRRRR
jgi:hypothetical protein